MEQKKEKIQRLLVTLDKTIANIKGETILTKQEMYDGFKLEDMPRYDAIAIREMGPLAEELIFRRNERIKNWGSDDWNNVIDGGNNLLLEMKKCLENHLQPSDPIMQELVNKWYELATQPLYNPTREEFLALCELNFNHPDFRERFDFYHTGLAAFMHDAARVFASKNLK